MPRTDAWREPHPLERRIALMRAAGASLAAISMLLEEDMGHVKQIIERPHVAHLVTLMTGMIADDVAPVAQSLSQEIEATGRRAFAIERSVMERLYAIEDSIKAQLGAAATAQDILDRAGQRAPAKSVQVNLHAVAPESIEHLGRAISEAMGRGGEEGGSHPAEGGGELTANPTNGNGKPKDE